MILADFGAEVIKVEDPQMGDYARENEPKLDENSAFFHSLNRNKKSVCIDLKTEKGKANFLKLVEKADVVVESFRPGVMKRLGIDYETLKTINPTIIYCAVTGYGQTGPYADCPGHDINYISYAGLLNLMGERDGKPHVPAAQIADIGGGALPATVGILLALLEKSKSGKGQMVDISMMDGVISWLQILLPGYLTNQEQPMRGKQTLSGGLACYEVYQTKDDRWLSVGALEPKFWEPFCHTIGKKAFISKLDAPIEEQDNMKLEIQSIIKQKSIDEWMALFSNLDTCVSPVLNFAEMVKDPQVIARDMVQTVDHRGVGKVKQIGNPIKLSEHQGETSSLAPKLGEHTEKIFAELEINLRH